MKILVTGANGFVGKNLVASLYNIKEGKDRTVNILIDEIFECTRETNDSALEEYCRECDFVYHLAGVNRPKDTKEFVEGNVDFLEKLLSFLKKNNNSCPVMFSSSVQASLEGKYAGSAYGRSKLEAEKLIFNYGKQNNVPVYVYRLPNLFGKWCKPNYNSVIATFCHNIANGLPISISDPKIELELLYIDDLIKGLVNLLIGEVTRCEYDKVHIMEHVDGKYSVIPVTHKVTLGVIVDLLRMFEMQPENMIIPEIPEGSFEKKLYSTYLSYLPKEKMSIPLKMNIDNRGSFTELFKSSSNGQVSVNISRPGITKGQHWHHSKWEFFVVVSGEALIQQRKIGSQEVLEFKVSGEKIEAVHMLPGYTHNIINLSDKDDLITVMWANEMFDKNRPDTFFEIV